MHPYPLQFRQHDIRKCTYFGGQWKFWIQWNWVKCQLSYFHWLEWPVSKTLKFSKPIYIRKFGIKKVNNSYDALFCYLLSAKHYLNAEAKYKEACKKAKEREKRAMCFHSVTPKWLFDGNEILAEAWKKKEIGMYIFPAGDRVWELCGGPGMHGGSDTRCEHRTIISW